MAPFPEGIAVNQRRWKVRATTAKGNAKSRSLMPKNALNFYNMKKGLYNKTSTRFRHLDLNFDSNKQFGPDDKAVKSLNLLNAYGELAGTA